MSKPDGIAGVFSVTPTQRGMLLGIDSSRDQSAHIVYVICNMEGQLRVAEFDLAWRRIVQRHPILRTGFGWNDKGDAFQFVRTGAAVPFEVVTDGRSVDEHIASDRRRKFDLGQPPLMRLAILPRGSHAADLVFCHHHAIMDGWAASRMLGEVMECYRAECRGGEPSLLPPVPFSHFVRWLSRRDADADLRFWQQRLGDFDTPVPIGRRERSAVARYDFGVTDWKSDTGLAAAVRSASQRLRVTPALLEQAAWALTLAHLTGRDDIVIGVTSSGRSAGFDGCDRVVGPLLVTLPQRFTIDARADADRWLAEAARVALDAAQHEHADPVTIRRAAAVPQGRPLFETVVVVQNFPVQAPQLAAAGLVLDLASVRVEGGQGTFPLMLMTFIGEVLSFRLVYHRASFEDSELPLLGRAFEAALTRLCSDAPRTLGEILDGMPSVTRGIWVRSVASRFIAPIGPLEQQVAEAWRDIFRRQVGRDDGFLDIGGNSLLALELASALSHRFQVDIPVRWIFEEGSVARVAARLRTRRSLPAARCNSLAMPRAVMCRSR